MDRTKWKNVVFADISLNIVLLVNSKVRKPIRSGWRFYLLPQACNRYAKTVVFYSDSLPYRLQQDWMAISFLFFRNETCFSIICVKLLPEELVENFDVTSKEEKYYCTRTFFFHFSGVLFYHYGLIFWSPKHSQKTESHNGVCEKNSFLKLRKQLRIVRKKLRN